MSESRAELVAALHPAGMQIRRMGQTLPHYWMDASAYQKLLYIVGTVLLVQNASKVEVDPFANQLVLLGQLYRQLLSPLFFFYNE